MGKLGGLCSILHIHVPVPFSGKLSYESCWRHLQFAEKTLKQEKNFNKQIRPESQTQSCFFHMVPVKYFEAAMKMSCWPVSRSTGATAPVQWCRKRRFSCPSPRGSKRQEATATPWTSAAAPEGRTCTQQPSVPYLPACSVQRGFQRFPLRDLLQISKLILLRQIGIIL